MTAELVQQLAQLKLLRCTKPLNKPRGRSNLKLSNSGVRSNFSSSGTRINPNCNNGNGNSGIQINPNSINKPWGTMDTTRSVLLPYSITEMCSGGGVLCSNGLPAIASMNIRLIGTHLSTLPIIPLTVVAFSPILVLPRILHHVATKDQRSWASDHANAGARYTKLPTH